MKNLLFTILIILVVNSGSDSQVLPLWQVSFNDSIPESNYAVKSKIDNQNNTVILADGTNSGIGTGVDYVIIKYNSSGQKLWNRRFDGTGHSSDYPSDMVIDRDNNIYITGRSWGGTTRNDYLTLKYSPDGVLLWERRFDWLVSRNDEAYAIALDSNENVYVTGFATAAFNGNELWDMITVKYNSSGEQKWVKTFAGFLDIADWGYTVACDLNGNIYVSGFTISASYLNHDIITVKYDSLGNEIWQRRFNNKGDDYIRPLFSKIDHFSNLVIASYFKTDSTYIDYLTYKYDTNGNLLWANIYDGGIKNSDWIHDLTIDWNNNVIITGSSIGNKTAYDYLTIKYSSSGNQLWLNRLNDSINNNSSSSDHAESIISDEFGNILVFGFSTYIQDYSCVLLYNSNGILLTKFRNFAIRNATSINFTGNKDFVITGLTDPKIYTARYLNIITRVSLNNIVYPNMHLLQQNFPNPFNPKTMIKYNLIKNSDVVLRVYDISGKELETIIYGNKNAGSHILEFEGNNYSSGIYLYSLFLNGSLIDTKRMFLIK